jgi:hypothetical protein
MNLFVLALLFGRACIFRFRLPAAVCTTVTAVDTGAASVSSSSGVGGLVSPSGGKCCEFFHESLAIPPVEFRDFENPSLLKKFV